ncbi:hypothetical protein ERC79_04265 [Rhodococcus sp. ABRD24]|uniref:Rv2732c family membrane protein n=1 Tax=Rhodococcus sp. ABRD24 TaxID=2507582 RepID=UPI00103FA8E5|nr:hypothetical protein [Rhodococcus sp. ABRD24]QBJ95255.1 hypothetical protein ERC79_04265 [Rhodococcus sp. ABRD24]
MSEDLSLLRRELSAIEERVAREVDPRGRGPVIGCAVMILVVALAAPQVDGLRAWQLLAGGHHEVAALSRLFTWFVVVFGIGVSAIAVLSRRWVVAWVAMAGVTVGSALGLLAYWSQHSVRSGAHTGSIGYGLLVEWAAMAVLAVLWIPVVAGRSNLLQR